MSNSSIYLDHAATTPVRPEVGAAMRPWLGEHVGNPASAHGFGRGARRALEDAREQVAALLGAFPDEVIFTSGATESNNLAIFGLCGQPPGHIVASPIEHPCVIEPVKHLAARGFTIRWLPVGTDGLVRADAMAGLASETRLTTVMLANHETGALQPIHGKTVGGYFHCDAAQAVGKLPLSFRELGVTTLSASAHKFGGPSGIGLLLLARGTKLQPLLFGGHQQGGRRPGTEPVALAVGLAKALELSLRERETESMRIQALRRQFLDTLQREAAPLQINGPADGGLPHILNVSFPGCRADAMLMAFDLAGVACSTGSACSSGSLLPSPVLKAMGLSGDRLLSAMRFSFGWTTTEAEIADASRRIVGVVHQLRETGND